MFDFDTIGSITDLHTGINWNADAFRRHIAGRRALLAAEGIASGSRVIIAHGNSPSFFADLFACWSLRACCICINPQLTANELSNITAFTRPDAMLVQDGTANLNSIATLRVINTATAPLDSAELTDSILENSDAPALVLFTSGTTGEPKGVVHTGNTLRARVELNLGQIPASALQRTLCVLPTHFGHGLIGNCLTPLLSSSQLLLYTQPDIKQSARLGKIIDSEQITFLSSVPAFWKIVLKVAAPPDRHSLQRIHIGSAPLAAELWRAVIQWAGCDEVCNMYGITETANWCAGASSCDFEPEDGIVGTPWGGRAAVRDTNGRVRPAGEGEIILDTPSMMAGYYSRDDLTAQVIHDGWYHTGDYGSIDDNGVIRLLGRTRSQINRAGHKVQPEEIDLLMEKHPAVAEACCFGLPDPVNGEMVSIAIRLTSPGTTPSELRDWCSERIRRECVPEKWYIVEDIPKTDRGKINRQHVKALCQDSNHTT